ncbi:MAG TPA: proton-conducting transporter membrane subunit [Thermoanaerobaculia bacterium]|nr:proton-conducting transporter membrane subunit [Thermoanaerobaculia bacterium]
MTPTSLELLAIASALVAFSGLPGLLTPAGSRAAQRVASWCHVAGCALGVSAAALALAGSTAAATFPWALPGGALTFALDRLSAFFLVPVFVVAGLGSVYGEGYWAEAHHPGNGRKLRFFYGLATAGLALVMVAGDAWSFLTGWEIVSLAAFFLVTTDQDDAAALRAGWIYFVAAHAATLILFAMFALLRDATGGWLLAPSAALGSSVLLTPILLLALAGFGLKAGVIPLHVWIPDAHAAAPSHVSALLSGVVLKMGIYGLVRLFSMLPAYPTWLGLALLALGVTSGVLGVVMALAQHDLKRLLAYHSIENIGIILIGLGVGALGMAQGRLDWAVLGFAGGLLHVWNHAAFKALLFHAAGAVIHATGTREIDALGGLMRRMRFTGAAFLLGAVAISGLPPLNGFVSEWLISLASFRALTSGNGGVGMLGAAAAAPALALIGALAVACFVKATSAVFLGTPRGPHATRDVADASSSMRFTMGALALSCAALGLWPNGATAVSRRAADALLGARAGTAPSADLGALGTVPLFVLAVIAATAVAGMALMRPVALTTTWDCGYASGSPRIQYTASSFAQMLVRLFRWAVLPDEHRPRLDGAFPAAGPRFESHAPDPALDRVLLPLFARGRSLLGLLHVIQAGRIQTYLLYIVVTLVVLLAWSWSW